MTDPAPGKKADDDPLQALMKEYQEYAYVVSHDLQAPIRQLQAFAEMLIKDIKEENLTSTQKSCRDMINYIVQEANQMMDALLTFSRFNTDEKVFKDIDLNKVVKEALLRAETKNGNPAYEIAIDPLPTVYGDYNLLLQAFYHLLDNALKFRKEDAASHIKIKAEKRGGQTVYSIEDNGIGIKENRMSDIFIILRACHGQDYKGRGVGLSFAKKIIQIHQGNIWVESTEGEGTKVFFTLCLLPE